MPEKNFPCGMCKIFSIRDDCEWRHDICPESHQEANIECPASGDWVFFKTDPHIKCQIHGAIPKPPPPLIYPLANLKPDWMPRMVAGFMDLAAWAYRSTDAEISAFAEKLSLAGVDFIRIFPPWCEPNAQPPYTMAFSRRTNGLFNLDLPSPEYDIQLKRVRDIFAPYHVRLLFDLLDNCGESWSPWKNNVNGMGGIYANDDIARKYLFQWADRIMAILPATDGHRIGLGNELCYPGDDMSNAMRAWTLEVFKPLGDRVFAAGYKPVSVSGAPATGHWCHGVLDPDHSTHGIRDCVLQLHNIGLIEDWDPNFGSDVRAYAYSDDGINVKDPAKRGVPTATGAYGASNAERVKLIAAWWAKYGKDHDVPRRLDSVEFLIRECWFSEPLANLKQESLDIYGIVGDMMGFNIRRKY